MSVVFLDGESMNSSSLLPQAHTQLKETPIINKINNFCKYILFLIILIFLLKIPKKSTNLLNYISRSELNNLLVTNVVRIFYI